MDFSYYPNISNNKFEEHLLKKKEFRNIHPHDKNKNTFQQLQPQQEFLKQYISPDTPYNGVLIFHGTGVGKTCTAINIAEGFREYSLKKNKKIIILSSAVVKHRFMEEIYNFLKPPNRQCIGDIYIKDIDLSDKTTDEKRRMLSKKIGKIYEFNGYLEFANKVIKKIIKSNDLGVIQTSSVIQKKINKLYSNRVIIIDEVHNLRKSNNSLENKKASTIVEAIVKYANNIKLVIMSATPMYDNAQEIVYILNLLLLNDNKELIKVSDIFNKLELKKGALDIITAKSKGYISYYRSERPYIFPFRLIPPETKILQYKYDINGNPMPSGNNLKYTYLYPCVLSKEHYLLYNKQFGIDLQNNGGNNSSNEQKMNSNKKDVLFLNISNKYNIIYPTSTVNKYVIGKEGIQKKKNNTGGLYKTNINKNIIYKYQNHAVDKSKVPFLDNSRLKLYSAKFHTVLNNCIKSNGKVFIYVSEIETGIVPLSIILEQNGFVKYTQKGGLPLLDSKYKQRTRCYQCGNHADDKQHDKSTPGYHAFKVAKYISLSSKNSDIINKTVTFFNSSNNKHGEELKIIIGTRILAEGIDFKGIRQLHIIEPWYNISRMEQVIGRAIRTYSHEGLDPLIHNVEIFMYVNTPSVDSTGKNKETETIDINIYRTAEQKDIQIKNIEHILKNNAIDCGLFEYTNIIHDNNIENQITSRGRHIKYSIKDRPYTRMCDYMKECAMKCKFSISNSNIINTNTYNIKDRTSKINTIKHKIKNLIKTSPVFNIETILNYIIDEPLKLFIYKALNDIIENKDEVVYNKIKGTLVYYNRYYLFQPRDILDKHVPLYYRNAVLIGQPKSIKINSNNIMNMSNDNKPNVTIDYNSILSDYNSLVSNITPFLTTSINTTIKFIIVEMIIDRLPLDLLSTIVNSYKDANKSNIPEFLTEYYTSIFKSQLKKIVVNKYKYVIDKNNINVSIRRYKNDFTKSLPVEYGIFDNKMNKFKLVDSTTNTNIMTKTNEISKKSKSIGRVCLTFPKKYINSIYGRIYNKVPILKTGITLSKLNGCDLIEFTFRYLKKHSSIDEYMIYINNL